MPVQETYEEMLERMQRDKGNAGAPEEEVKEVKTPSTVANPNAGVTNPADWVYRDTTTGEEIPATETPQTTTTGVGNYYIPQIGNAPKESDYDYNRQFFDTYFEEPLTDEERARRERAAYISSGVANLGKAFGALGNMFFAAHGAPAQQAPTIPDVDAKVDAFRERADKVRNAYINGGLAARKSDKAEYGDAYTRWLNDVKTRNAVVSAQQSYDAKIAKIQATNALNDVKQRYWEAKIAGQEALARKYEAQADQIIQLFPELVANWRARTYAANALGDKRQSETGDRTTVTTTNPADLSKTSVTSYNNSNNGTNTHKNNGGGKHSGFSIHTKK